MSRVVRIAFMVVAMILVVGCGGKSQTSQQSSAPRPAPAKHPKLEIVGSGFTQGTGRNPYINGAAVLKNPSKDQAAIGVQVTVVIYGTMGPVVATNNQTLAAIYPGDTSAVFSWDQGTGAARMEVEAVVDRWTPATAPGSVDTSNITNQPASFFNDGDNDTKTTGIVTSTYSMDITNATLVAVYYDGSGHIMGGDWSRQVAIPANGHTAFELDAAYIHASDIAKTEVYVTGGTLAAP